MAKSFLIALPVRNGGAHLRQCVASILAQTYASFELVVLDNASTDGTSQWLREQSDSRITVIASSSALSIEENWARVRHIADRHEYMTITGHDDVFDPEFLQITSELIDAQPEAGLYMTHFRLIDGDGNKIRSCAPMSAIERGHEFLRARLSMQRDSFGTGYVFRCSDYRRVGGIPPLPKLLFADDALWLSLMQGSYKATHPKECFSYRVHSGSTSFAPDWRSTLEALWRYLVLLRDHAAKDAQMKEVLREGLTEYLLFWFRWARFCGPQSLQDRRDFEQQVAISIEAARAVLTPAQLSSYERRVRSATFGPLARAHWFVWRLRRRLVRKLDRAAAVS